jgi:hypothetical protein
MKYYSALSDISGSLTSASTIVQVVSAMADGSALVSEVSNGTFSDNSFGPASGGFGTITIVRRSKYRAYAIFVGKDNGMPSTCSVVADTSSYAWAAPGSFEYEHTNETNTRNVPTNPRHWFNYRNGDTDTVDSDNLISEYHFGNRGGSEKGVNLVADGLTGRTFTSGSNNAAWCIKCTRLANSGRGHIAVRVMLDRSTDTDDFGFIDIVIKFSAGGGWYAYAYPFVRRTQATSFGEVLYVETGGIVYIGIRCTGYFSRVVPIILGDNRNNIFNIEFGEFSSEVSSLTFHPLRTRFPVYADYNDNAMAAIGSSTQPVYVNANGEVKVCKDAKSYSSSAEIDYSYKTHFFTLSNGSNLKKFTIDVTKLQENISYEFSAVNTAAAYTTFSFIFKKTSTAFYLYGCGVSAKNLSSGNFDPSSAGSSGWYGGKIIKIVRIGTNVYVIGY